MAGRWFAYGAGEARPGYHRVEPLGGLVHADSRVIVSYVVSPYYGRAEIVRLAARTQACLPAPDLGPAG